MLVVQKRRDAMRFAVRWSVNRSLNALFYFHTRGTVVGRGFLNVRAHLQLHRLASRRAGAERVRLIRTVSLSAGLPSRSIWPQVFARGLLRAPDGVITGTMTDDGGDCPVTLNGQAHRCLLE